MHVKTFAVLFKCELDRSHLRQLPNRELVHGTATTRVGLIKVDLPRGVSGTQYLSTLTHRLLLLSTQTGQDTSIQQIPLLVQQLTLGPLRETCV